MKNSSKKLCYGLLSTALLMAPVSAFAEENQTDAADGTPEVSNVDQNVEVPGEAVDDTAQDSGAGDIAQTPEDNPAITDENPIDPEESPEAPEVPDDQDNTEDIDSPDESDDTDEPGETETPDEEQPAETPDDLGYATPGVSGPAYTGMSTEQLKDQVVTIQYVTEDGKIVGVKKGIWRDLTEEEDKYDHFLTVAPWVPEGYKLVYPNIHADLSVLRFGSILTVPVVGETPQPTPPDDPKDPEDPPVDPEDPPVDPEDPPVDPEDPPVDPEDPKDPEEKPTPVPTPSQKTEEEVVKPETPAKKTSPKTAAASSFGAWALLAGSSLLGGLGISLKKRK